MARPVRLGFASNGTLDAVRRGAALACSSWGGQYHVFLPWSDEETARKAADLLAVDAIYALDRGPTWEHLAELPGYSWYRFQRRDPFNATKEVFASQLLGPEWLIDSVPAQQLVLPQWESDDPLADLFRVWFGTFDVTNRGTELEPQFSSVATDCHIALNDSVPNILDRITPVALTARNIEYKGIGAARDSSSWIPPIPPVS